MVVSNLDQDTDKLFSELEKSKRRRGSCFSFKNILLGFLFIIFTVITGIALAVASTGMVKIPLISQLAYPEHPLPIRTVEPATPEQSQILSGKINFNNSTATTIDINEAELTALIRTPNDKGEVAIKQGQVAITPNTAELYGIVNVVGKNSSILRLNFIQQGDDVVLNSMHLGYLAIPISSAKQIISSFAGNDFLSLKSALNSLFSSGETVSVESVFLDEGKLKASIRLTS